MAKQKPLTYEQELQMLTEIKDKCLRDLHKIVFAPKGGMKGTHAKLELYDRTVRSLIVLEGRNSKNQHALMTSGDIVFVFNKPEQKDEV